jgi:DNA-binding MarR family transcriptional regulator
MAFRGSPGGRWERPSGRSYDCVMHPVAVNTVGSWTLLVTDAMEGAALEATELPGRGLAALVLLTNRPGSSVDWLSRRLGLTQSGAVRLVDRLGALGLLRREKQPGRKEVSLHVTAAGEACLRQGLAARAAAIRTLVEPLSAGEQRQLGVLAGKVLAGGTRRRDEADVACRLCDWQACKPVCPVDASVAEGSTP